MPVNLGPGFSAPTLQELQSGNLPKVERRMTTLVHPGVTTEYRTADRVQDYTARLRRLEALCAETDQLSYLLED
jgi:hypothetical protein